MQALVKSHNRLGVSIQNKPIPKVGSNDVLVKVKYAAICGTDVSIYKWTEWAQKEIPLGTTLGHEFVGNIIEKGTDITGIEIGDLVTAECHGYCQKCSICLKGYKHLCVKSRNIGIHVDGAFAQYVLIPQQNIVKLNETSDIDHRILALLDPLGNAVHCIQSFSIKNASILIIGAGPIGLMLTSILKHSGNNTIVMIDYNIYRLQIAKDLGADLVINLNQVNEKKDEWLDYILQEKEFDFGFEVSGSSEGLQNLVKYISPNGQIILFGIFSTLTSLDINNLIFKGVNLKGIYGRNKESWVKSFSLLQNKLNIESIITHEYKLKDFQQGFEKIMSGKAGKVILSID